MNTQAARSADEALGVEAAWPLPLATGREAAAAPKVAAQRKRRRIATAALALMLAIGLAGALAGIGDLSALFHLAGASLNQ